MIGDYDTISKIISYEIVDLLIKLEINKTLFECYNVEIIITQDYQKNYYKYEKLNEELNRLLTIFSTRMKFLNKNNNQL